MKRVLVAVVLVLVASSLVLAQPSGVIKNCGSTSPYLTPTTGHVAGNVDAVNWLNTGRGYHSVVFTYTTPAGSDCDVTLSRSVDSGVTWVARTAVTGIANETVEEEITLPVGMYKATMANCTVTTESITIRYMCGAGVGGRP